MKNCIKIFTACLLSSLILSGCANKTALKNGIYTGTSMGHNGPVEVSMTVAKGKISGVTIVKHVETTGVCENAIARVTAAIVEKNTPNVDSVSGATITSYAVMSAVKDAIKNAGGNPDVFPAKAETKQLQERTLQCDIAVIGGGGAGLSAAAKAQSGGAHVILIEKNGQLGGDTVLNAGTLIATGSKFQKEKLHELKDSPELAARDIMKVGKNANDPELVRMLTTSIGGTVDWLVDDMKVPYDVAATQYPDHSASRQIGVVGRSPEFIKVMSANFEKAGGKIYLETRAESLITDSSNAVTGVMASDKQGKIRINAKKVIMACGGFGAASDLLPKTLAGYKFYGRSTETGDGLKMATAIGADTTNLDMVKVYPQGVETEPGRALAATASSTAACSGHGAIYVNSDGKRVIKETATLGELTDITVTQKDKILYIVMDDDAWKTYVAKSLEDKLVSSEDDLNRWAQISNNGKPVMVTGNDPGELADKIGINADNLKKTIAKYNAGCASGRDEFGKTNPVALADGTYHIVEQKPRFATTLGGLKANTKMQILDKSGNPVANLYGAGCVVGGGNGRDSMTAMMNSWAIGTGAVAGKNAAEALK